MRLLAALGAAILAAAIVAGCGSSSNNSSSATPAALTKQEFLKKGNAICKKGNKQIKAGAKKQFPKSGGKPSQAQLTRFVQGTIITSVQSQIDAVKALGAPAGDEAQVNAIVTMNSGKLSLRLVAPDGHWLVDGIDWEGA